MTINFYLNNDKRNNNPEKIIYCYVREQKKTIVLHTKERINPEFWDSKKQIVKKSYLGSPEINQYLTKFKEAVQKNIRLLRIEKINPSFEEIKEALLNVLSNKKEIKFFDSFDEFIELRKPYVTGNTIKKFKSLKRHLSEFEDYSKESIKLNSINQLFFERFANFLLLEKNHINNTIYKELAIFKIFLNWCYDRNLIEHKDYNKFKIKTHKVDSVALTEAELMKLYNLEFLELENNRTLERVRDVFCFGCFTGQRFSDISRIKREDLKGDFWHLRIVKTTDKIEIPLNDFAKSILNKYADEVKPLPVISEQKTNQYLKELCRMAGIDDKISITRYKGAEKIEQTFEKYELITTHTARQTFVTLSLEKGMRPETVMEITGHKDYKTFTKYIKMTNKVKKVEMNKIWKKEPVLKLVNY